jgi:hypothetical protein
VLEKVGGTGRDPLPGLWALASHTTTVGRPSHPRASSEGDAYSADASPVGTVVCGNYRNITVSEMFCGIDTAGEVVGLASYLNLSAYVRLRYVCS